VKNMAKQIQNFIATVSIILLVILLGCSALQDPLTPCYISPAVLKYADANGTSLLPWTTLFDAKRVTAKLSYVHSWSQISDQMEYEYLLGIQRFHNAGAEELKATLFSPTGPIGFLLPASLAGTAGALLISKPSDKKKIKDLETKNNKKTT